MSTVLADALLPTYPPTRVTFVEGDGVTLTDDAGRTYLDFASGIAALRAAINDHLFLRRPFRQKLRQ